MKGADLAVIDSREKQVGIVDIHLYYNYAIHLCLCQYVIPPPQFILSVVSVH